jgi:hypothetical protein
MSGDASEAMHITEEVALSRLDEASTQLQKEGRYLEALECMERGLVLRQRMFGVKSEEVRSNPNARLFREPPPLLTRVSRSPSHGCAGLVGMPRCRRALQPPLHVVPAKG